MEKIMFGKFKKWIALIAAIAVMVSGMGSSFTIAAEEISEIINEGFEDLNPDYESNGEYVPEGANYCLYYTIYNGKAEIVDCEETATGRVVIPSHIEGYPVTSIGLTAFNYCSDITGVEIPETVTVINPEAFEYCDSLKEVFIPKSVSIIGDSVFDYCNSLEAITVSEENENYCDIDGVLFDKAVTILIKFPANKILTEYTVPTGVKDIGRAAFQGSSVLKVIFCDGLEYIDKYAFEYCDIEEATLPQSLRSIDYKAFCFTNLVTINIPKNVTFIRHEAFIANSRLENVTVDDENEHYADIDGVLFDKDITILYRYPDAKTEKTYTLPDSVTSVTYSAFENCDELESIILPEGLKYISGQAFRYCYSLKEIDIPDGVTKIGPYTFSGCTSLESVNLPDSLEHIEYDAFSGCSKLNNLTIPESVKVIDSQAFGHCEGITDVFYLGTEEEWNNIEINYNVDCCDQAFYNANIHFGCGCDSDWSDWELISESTCTAKGIEERECLDCGEKHTKYSPTLSHTYENAVCTVCEYELYTPVEDFNYSYDYDYDTESDFIYITSYRGDDKEVLIPAEIDGVPVNKIDSWAFQSGYGVEKVYISENIKYVEQGAFDDGSIEGSITDIIALSSNPYLSSVDGVLYNKDKTSIIYYPRGKKITEFVIPDSVEIISPNAFYNCSRLENITIPNSVKYILEYAFQCCYGLTEINIPESAENIDNTAFVECHSLENIIVDENNQCYKSIDGVLFNKDVTDILCYPNGKTSESYEIPDSVTVLSSNAFYYCDSLINISIPEGVTYIGNSTFSNCNSLEKIIIPSTIERIENYAFNYCYNLTDVLFPDKVFATGVDIFRDSGVYNNPDNWENGLLYVGKHLVDSRYDLSGTVEIKKGTLTIADNSFAHRDISIVKIPKSLLRIGDSTFHNTHIETVYYYSTEEDWNEIDFTGGNLPLLNAVIHFSCSCGSINFSDWVTLVEPTCSTEGTAERECLDCGEKQTAKLPKLSHEIVDEICVSCGANLVVFETSHPYENDLNEWYTHTFEGAKEIEINFSENSYTESGCDFIEIFDGNYNFLGQYSGDMLVSQTITVEGDTASIRFITDGSVTEYGFYAELIPFYSDCDHEWSDWVVISQPTCMNTGIETKTCLLCSKEKTSVLGVVGCYYVNHYCIYCNSYSEEGGETTQEFQYDIINNDTITITGYMNTRQNVDIPYWLDGYLVTAIGYDAFYDNDFITSVTIPDSVTHIGYYAFYDCDNLETVYYYGTPEMWRNITIKSGNDSLYNAELIFYCEAEKGDTNCDGTFDSSDLIDMQKYLLTGEILSESLLTFYDVNGDDTVDIRDLVALKEKVAESFETDVDDFICEDSDVIDG